MALNNKISKKDITKRVAEKAGISQIEAGRLYSLFAVSIRDALAKGEAVSIPNVGSFHIKKRAAKKGFNPVTNEHSVFEERNAVAFTVSKGLKNIVKETTAKS